MNLDTHIPVKALSPFVKAYLIIECPDEQVNRVLPDTSLVMAFRYKGQVNYRTNDIIRNDLPASLVTGLRKSGRLINYSRNAANILILFKAAGAAAFFKEPLNELFEDSVSLSNFTGYRHVADIEEQLAGAANNTQRIALIERFLLSRLCNPQADALIAAAMEKIRQAKGIIRIKELAGSLYISQDAFEKRFRRVVGASPKQFSYIVRMKSILSANLKKQTLAGIAFDAGYFDQPHFNKDFKLFTGQTPGDFLKSSISW